ncbi:MAG TPA: DegV family protein [Chloroflexi bacterium]|nr:DegV family protein [Chloroflexota bacterium]
MGNQKIVVVTDSSACIPQKALEGLNVAVIPLWLMWENDHFRDGVDIDPPAFYRRLRSSKTIPTSSQPTVEEIVTFFRDTVEQENADVLVNVIVSHRISNTFTNVQAAQEQVPELNIRVVDSFSSSAGLALIVLAAARAAADGRTTDEIVAIAEDLRDRVHFLFAVDTLEYLHRGGRIGGAKRLLGTALNIKPLLHFSGGQIEPLLQVRTKRKAIAKMLDVAEERLEGKEMAEAIIPDVDTPQEGDSLVERVRERFGIERVIRSAVSPVVGTHVGPGGVGIAFYAKH